MSCCQHLVANRRGNRSKCRSIIFTNKNSWWHKLTMNWKKSRA